MIYQKALEGLAKVLLGKSLATSTIAHTGTLKKKRFRQMRARLRMLQTVSGETRSQMKDFHARYAALVAPVTAPMTLISQIQRSGGSFLSQLFDGHPQVHAHPHELKIGYPKKYLWPQLDLNESPQRWFEFLFEDDVIAHFREGYKKSEKTTETFPFVFLPSLQRKIFLDYLSAVDKPISHRNIFDAYMTSYFGAWLNNQNMYGDKKTVTAFTPRLAMRNDSVKSFFEIYPDGRLISVIRDPTNWYPSARRHENKKRKYDDLRQALAQWSRSARTSLWNKEHYNQRVCIIRFEDIVSRTEPAMRYLASFLGIEFDPILLTPTFNSQPIAANTSFKLEKSEIMTGTLSRYQTLADEELRTIEEITGEDYRRALAQAAVF
ncbi:MAG: sulfotransferase [Desulfopila sp.]